VRRKLHWNININFEFCEDVTSYYEVYAKAALVCDNMIYTLTLYKNTDGKKQIWGSAYLSIFASLFKKKKAHSIVSGAST
jgi:hypothetical protein